jgi:hypothetical protein
VIADTKGFRLGVRHRRAGLDPEVHARRQVRLGLRSSSAEGRIHREQPEHRHDGLEGALPVGRDDQRALHHQSEARARV